MIALINASLIDGTGSPPVAGATVVIQGKRITEAGAGVPIPDGATVIDLKGKTLLPAFSDVHTHFGGTDMLTRPGLGGSDATYDYALNSGSCIDWGVTTVRSAGDFMPDLVSYRSDAAMGGLRAPRILTAGRMFVARGGHPLYTVYSGNEDIRDNACVVCDDSTDIDAEVKKLADAGVDWIKAFLSTINKMDYPNPVPRLPHETLKKISDSAHKYGKPVMIHVETPQDAEEAVDIGADSIEHLIGVGTTNFEISDVLLKKLADSSTHVVPTLVGIKAHDGGLAGAQPVYSHLEKAVKKLADAVVKLGVGCDSGIPFVPCGESIHTEMELFVSAGISPLDALCMATSGNAKLLRLDGSLGTIEPGKLADLVVLNANPLEDIRNTRSIALVIKEGSVVVDKMLAG